MSKLHEIEIRTLHPTQIRVGMIKVTDKCIGPASLKKHKQCEFLFAHPVPAVRGPEDEPYIANYHHLTRNRQAARTRVAGEHSVDGVQTGQKRRAAPAKLRGAELIAEIIRGVQFKNGVCEESKKIAA